jgi:hypothetical protein
MNGFGIFQLTILAGCTPDWTPGTYTVTASAASPGETASASTTFEYYLGLVALDRVTATVAPQSVLGDVMVTITGTVAACSGSVAPTNVLISVKNPSGATVFQDQVTPTGPVAYGNYTDSFVAGGTPDWTPGVYTVTSQYRSSSNPPSQRSLPRHSPTAKPGELGPPAPSRPDEERLPTVHRASRQRVSPTRVARPP